MFFESTVVFTIRQSEERRRDDESVYCASFGRGDKKKLEGSHICRTVVWLEKTAQRDHCREKKTVDVTRVSGTFLESQTVDCGKTKPRTEMRETRQQVRLRHPVTLLLVRCVGRGVSAGGHSRPGAMAREGASSRSRRARARAKERARLDPSASSLRVDVEGFERNIVASTSSTRVWSFACEGAGETRGTRTRPRSPPRETAPTVSLPGPRSKAFGRPPLRWWPRQRTSSPTPHACPSQTKTRRSVSPSLTDGERVGADRESARAPKTPTRSRSPASACARRKCVVLARLRVRGARRPGRERSGEALRRRRQRREFRRHRT